MTRLLPAVVALFATIGCVNVEAPKHIDVNVPSLGWTEPPADRPASADERTLEPGRPTNAAWGPDLAQAETAPSEPATDAKPVRRSTGGKLDTAGQIAAAVLGQGAGGSLLFGQDVLTPPDKEIELRAHVRSYQKDRSMAGLKLTFTPVGDAKPLGEAVTDADGWASIRWTPKRVGFYSFEIRVTSTRHEENREFLDLPAADLWVLVREPETKFVVVDLDHTLTDSNFFRVAMLDGGRPMRNAPEVMQRIGKTWQVLYLTHRPTDLTRKSRQWLISNKFPKGPILMSTLSQAVGSSGKYKADRLKEIRKTFPNLVLGIGDKTSDVEAYVANGLEAYWIPDFDRDDAGDLRKTARIVRTFAAESKVHVAANWKDIERGIFDAKPIAPKTFADQLDRDARHLKRADNDDDDDDEDEDDDDD